MPSRLDAIIETLKANSNPKNVEGMARFGINPQNTLGVSIPTLRQIAKETGKSHEIALELWETGIHEARILASMIDDPNKTNLKQLDRWVRDFDSWDVCDQCCLNLIAFVRDSFKLPARWVVSDSEFVRRAGFALMAVLAVKHKKADDAHFEDFLALIEKYSCDERNFVKKAVNWALRQIGKRNSALHAKAIETANKILALETKSGKWIALDAIRELESEAVIKRMGG